MIIIRESTKEEAASVQESLMHFNENQVPLSQKKRIVLLNYIAKNGGEQLVGGINAVAYNWGIIFVHILWVDENHRGQGIGNLLLNTVIEQGKKMDCSLIHLDTFDFQSRDFYEKLGFEVFGVLNNCPPGHKRYYLKKNIV